MPILCLIRIGVMVDLYTVLSLLMPLEMASKVLLLIIFLVYNVFSALRVHWLACNEHSGWDKSSCIFFCAARNYAKGSVCFSQLAHWELCIKREIIFKRIVCIFEKIYIYNIKFNSSITIFHTIKGFALSWSRYHLYEPDLHHL